MVTRSLKFEFRTFSRGPADGAQRENVAPKGKMGGFRRTHGSPRVAETPVRFPVRSPGGLPSGKRWPPTSEWRWVASAGTWRGKRPQARVLTRGRAGPHAGSHAAPSEPVQKVRNSNFGGWGSPAPPPPLPPHRALLTLLPAANPSGRLLFTIPHTTLLRRLGVGASFGSGLLLQAGPCVRLGPASTQVPGPTQFPGSTTPDNESGLPWRVGTPWNRKLLSGDAHFELRRDSAEARVTTSPVPPTFARASAPARFLTFVRSQA